MTSHATRPRLPGTPELRGWILWGVFFVVIAVILIAGIKPSHVTKTYFPTAETWWGGEQDIYTGGITGYLYLPQSLYLFTPFLAFPEGPAREIAWRLFGFALFAFGLRRVLRRTAPDGGARHFEFASLLVVLAAAASARNGQTNMHLAGLMLHACADLMDGRWWRATFVLFVGMLAKPIAAVMVLLVGALAAPMRLRLVVGVAAFYLLPYLHHDLGYAHAQYQLGFEKLARSSQPGAKPYDDMIGILRSLGIQLPEAVRLGMGLVAALLTLALAAAGLRRGGFKQGMWILTALAACYLMLFNPRTETNSYVILVPWIAMLATYAYFDRADRRAATGFIAGCLALGADNYGRWFLRMGRGWFKPTVALLFFVYLAWRIRGLADRPLLPSAGDPPADPT